MRSGDNNFNYFPENSTDHIQYSKNNRPKGKCGATNFKVWL